MFSNLPKLTKEFDAYDLESKAANSDAINEDDMLKTASPRSRASRLQQLLLPELLQSSDASRSKLRATAYLDGLRGLAAFVVYLSHNLLSANHLFVPIEVAYGYEGRNRNLINFPFLRLLITGSHVAVPIFFVISGYVQARKPLQQIHNKQDISGTLASAIFRRPFRLYIPVIGSTLSFAVLWHLLGVTPTLTHHESTLLTELGHYFKALWSWTYILRTKNKDYFTDHQRVQEAWFDYNGHTWTIPVELQGSIIVFLFLLTLSKTSAKARISITSAAAVYFLYQGGCYVFTFLAGSVIAELDLLNTLPQDFLISHKSAYRAQLFLAMLVVGCYIGAPPAQGLLFMSSEMLALQPGFYYVSKFVPWIYYDTIHFLVSVASILIILPIMALPLLRRPFESRILQYLGRISFSLYLVHGPIIETFGMFMYAVVGKLHIMPDKPVSPWHSTLPVPKIGPLGMDLPFIVANLVILPVTLCVAEICMRLFDENSVLIARRAYEFVLDY